MKRSNKTINVKSKIVNQFAGIVFYSVALLFLPLFWLMVDSWLFKLSIAVCGVVCIGSIVLCFLEIRRLKKLQRKTVQIVQANEADGEDLVAEPAQMEGVMINDRIS